jgi:hypothetical protein
MWHHILLLHQQTEDKGKIVFARYAVYLTEFIEAIYQSQVENE